MVTLRSAGVNALAALSFRESMFSPSEVAESTGLSPAMQRSWRREGHLPARTGGIAHFGPRELAEIAIMVAVRGMGLGPSTSRAVAEVGAPSVIWHALTEPGMWVVTGPPALADKYRHQLELTGDAHLRIMAGVQDGPYRYGVSDAGQVNLVAMLQDELDDESPGAAPVAAVLKLWVLGRKIAQTARRPLVTVLLPPEFS